MKQVHELAYLDPFSSVQSAYGHAPLGEFKF